MYVCVCLVVAGGGEDSDDDYLQFYLVMRAVDRFVAEYRRCPGFEDHTVDADIPLLKVAKLFIIQQRIVTL